MLELYYGRLFDMAQRRNNDLINGIKTNPLFRNKVKSSKFTLPTSNKAQQLINENKRLLQVLTSN